MSQQQTISPRPDEFVIVVLQTQSQRERFLMKLSSDSVQVWPRSIRARPLSFLCEN